MKLDFLTDSITRLVTILNKAAPGDLDHDIAAKILTHMEEIANGNIRDAAEVCYVSTSTISRFVKKLKFENFNSFKYKLASDLFNMPSSNSILSDREKNGFNDDAAVQVYFQRLNAHVESVQAVLTKEKLDDICEILHQAPSIIIFSHQDLDFTSFQAKMACYGKISTHLNNNPEDYIPNIPKNTAFIAPLFATSNALSNLEKAKRDGANVISICRNGKYIFDDIADISLVIDSDSVEFNRYMLNFIFDAIIINYHEKYQP